LTPRWPRAALSLEVLEPRSMRSHGRHMPPMGTLGGIHSVTCTPAMSAARQAQHGTQRGVTARAQQGWRARRRTAAHARVVHAGAPSHSIHGVGPRVGGRRGAGGPAALECQSTAVRGTAEPACLPPGPLAAAPPPPSETWEKSPLTCRCSAARCLGRRSVLYGGQEG